MLSSSHSKTHSLPLLPIRYNSSRFDRTATCVFGNCAKRRSFGFASTSSVVRGAKVVRERGERMRLRDAGVGEGGRGRDGNGPVWAAAAGLGRPTTRKVPPPPTYANGNDARGRHPSLPRPRPTDAWTRGRTDGRSLPASSAAAAYRGRSRLSYALRQSRVAVCTYAPPLRVSRDFFCFPWQ